MELKIREEVQIEDAEAYRSVKEFIEENNDLDGIYRIQIDEILTFLKSGLDSKEAPSNDGSE